MNHEAEAVRARLNAMMALLTDEGHMTPMAMRQLGLVLDEEGIA